VNEFIQPKLDQLDLIQAYRKALLAYAFTILRDHALAEDIVQEVALILTDRIGAGDAQPNSRTLSRMRHNSARRARQILLVGHFTDWGEKPTAQAPQVSTPTPTQTSTPTASEKEKPTLPVEPPLATSPLPQSFPYALPDGDSLSDQNEKALVEREDWVDLMDRTRSRRLMPAAKEHTFGKHGPGLPIVSSVGIFGSGQKGALKGTLCFVPNPPLLEGASQKGSCIRTH